MLQTKF